MIDGYWTCILCVMIMILLATGWSQWLAPYVNVRLLVIAILSIWCMYRFNWTFQVPIKHYILQVNASIVIIFVLYWLLPLKHAKSRSSILLMYMILFSLLWTMLSAIIIFLPWAEANISLWYVPLLSGVIMGALGITLQQMLPIIYVSSIGEEILLVFQQKGDYITTIGSLTWWDGFSVKVIFATIFILLFKFVEKLIPIVMNFVLKRREG